MCAVASLIPWLLRLFAALIAGGLQSLRFALQSPADRLRSAGRILADAKKGAKLAVSPLRFVSEGLYRIEPAFLGRGEAGEAAQPVVIYFTGTGETVHAPLPAYRALVQAAQGLAELAHFVVEAPLARGAYYGSSAFSSRMWERVQPIVQQHAGPFVLVGLSRGAIAALDMGARLAEEHGKVAAVLAMSPPLKLPSQLPNSIVEVAAFEPIVERISAALPHVPQIFARLAESIVRHVHVYLTAVLQAELGMLGDEDFKYAQYDIDLRGPIESSARAVREFRLLVEAPDGELLHFANRVACVAARTPRFFAALVWGERDGWVRAASCEERMVAALARENTPQDRVITSIQDGGGHGLFREHARSLEPVAALFERVKHEAQARHQVQCTEAEKARHFERKLRASEHPPRLNED